MGYLFKSFGTLLNKFWQIWRIWGHLGYIFVHKGEVHKDLRPFGGAYSFTKGRYIRIWGPLECRFVHKGVHKELGSFGVRIPSPKGMYIRI